MIPVPLVIIRSDADALITVNGQPAGECSNGGHVALPVSDTGDYYICAHPLNHAGSMKHCAVMRKFTFEGGVMTKGALDDADVVKWPQGVDEIGMKVCKVYDAAATPPHVVERMSVPQHSGTPATITLYYENGLRAVAEDGACGATMGYALGYGTHGSISFIDAGDVLLSVIHAKLVDTERAVALDGLFRPILDVEGDSVFVEDGRIVCIKRANTLLRHEEMTVHEYVRGEFKIQKRDRGFFTRAYERPKGNADTARAFCEAVKEGFREETMSYLTEDMRKNLDFSQIRTFLGEFSSVRTPVGDVLGTAVGLISRGAGGISEARLFSFEFDNGLVSNMAEL